MKKIVIYSTRACPYCIIAKRALDGRGIPYEEIDITTTPHVRDELAAKTGEWTVPQVFVDGEYIGQDDELVALVESGALDAEGHDTGPDAHASEFDIAVIGAGSTGIATATIAAELGRVALFERPPLTPGADPARDKSLARAERAGVTLITAEVFGIEPGERDHGLVTLDRVHTARTVVIATGSKDRAPELPGEAELSGKGVSRCAECDGAFFTGLPVAVVGTDERAAVAAGKLAATASRVDLICPEEVLTVTDKTRERLAATHNLKVWTGATVTTIHGDTHVTGLTFKDKDGNHEPALSGVFCYLPGNLPASGFAAHTIPPGKDGRLPVNDTGETAIPGIFAIGAVAGGPDDIHTGVAFYETLKARLFPAA